MNRDDFYLKFEEQHRGDCALIKKRLAVYKPFLEKIISNIPEPKALDLGCGRGEWLELLQEHTFLATGVDLDQGMLRIAKQKNLNVIHGDAIEVLKNEADNSLALVSGFHIAEHISFDMLLLLIQEAQRVLKPGGLLILETPNPENIRVATSGFYMDPTHLRPLPSELLLFLVQQSGFYRALPLYLQEAKHLKSELNIQLLEVLGGVSPDYAVIGQKAADKVFLQSFDTLFETEYGINLETLANKFEARIAKVQTIKQQVEQKDKATREEIQTIKQQVEQKDKATREEIHLLRHELTSMHNSLSWKITYPLRLLNRWRKWFFLGVYSWITLSDGSRPKRVSKRLFAAFKEWIKKHPSLCKVTSKSCETLQKQDHLKYQAPQSNNLLRRLQHLTKSMQMDKK